MREISRAVATRRCARRASSKGSRTSRSRRCSTPRATRTTRSSRRTCASLFETLPAANTICRISAPRRRGGARAPRAPLRRDRRARLLERARARGRRRLLASSSSDCAPDAPGATHAASRATRARPHLGHPQGHPHRPHRQRLADPPLHRSAPRSFKFVPARATSRSPASCASTCSRPSTPTRATAAPSKCCCDASICRRRRCGRSPRSSTTSTCRDGKFGRPETAGVDRLIAGVAHRHSRRRGPPRARRDRVRRPLRVLQEEEVMTDA